ncbi:MAG: hypothetical protein ACI9BV_003712 [Rhodothermales bacterium]|jgi:hypothetical protein
MKHTVSALGLAFLVGAPNPVSGQARLAAESPETSPQSSIEWRSLKPFGPEERSVSPPDPLLAMALGPRGLLTVWTERVDGSARIISMLGPNGNAELVDAGETDALRPTVAYDESRSQFLVVWLSPDGRLRARNVDSATGNTLGEPFLIEGPRSVRTASLTAGRGAPLLVWQETDESGASEVFATMLSGEGTGTSTVSFRLSTTGSDDADSRFDSVSPRAAYDEALERFLVVWSSNGSEHSAEPSAFRLAVRELDLNGRPLGRTTTLTTGRDTEVAAHVRWPAVAWGGESGEYYVTWTRQVGTGFSVQGLAFSPSSSSNNELPDVLSHPDAQSIHPSVDFIDGAGGYVATWEARLNDGSRRIEARVVTDEPGDRLELPAAPGVARRPQVISLGGGQVKLGWSQAVLGIGTVDKRLPTVLTPAMELPSGTILAEAFPNPFAGQARLNVAVAEEQQVDVVMFDMLGREVMSLFSGVLRANRLEQLVIDGSRLPSGSYMVRLRGVSLHQNLHLVLVR